MIIFLYIYIYFYIFFSLITKNKGNYLHSSLVYLNDNKTTYKLVMQISITIQRASKQKIVIIN